MQLYAFSVSCLLRDFFVKDTGHELAEVIMLVFLVKDFYLLVVTS